MVQYHKKVKVADLSLTDLLYVFQSGFIDIKAIFFMKKILIRSQKAEEVRVMNFNFLDFLYPLDVNLCWEIASLTGTNKKWPHCENLALIS